MKRYILTIVILSVFVGSCVEKKHNLPTDNIVKEVFVYILDSLINTELSHYDICGIFNEEFSEDFILKSLEDIDSLFSEEDKSYLLEQYRDKKGKEINKYINESNYIRKDGTNYYPEDSLNFHLSFSVPLFTVDNNYAVVYHVGRSIKVKSSIDGFYFLLKRENKSWILIDVIKNPYTKPNVETHSHPFSLIPKRNNN